MKAAVSSGFASPSLIGLLLLASLMTAGCATYSERMLPIRNQFASNDLEGAKTQLVELHKKRKKDRDVLVLDQAMIELAQGRSAEAEKLLRASRDRFDHLSQKSLAEGAASMVTDDNAIAYPGEDYEQVLIRVMLTLTNLMNGGQDAEAYALQIAEKQEELLAKQKTDETPEENSWLKAQAYQQVALGPYVRAMLAEESPLTLDDAVRARVKVAEYAPDFSSAKADLQRAQHEVPIPPGHGVLYVFALVGRGPIKEQVNAEATQAALLIADRIVSAVSPRGLPPTLAPVPIPKVRTSSLGPRNMAITIDGQPVGKTETLVDVGRMAALQQEAKEPEIIARAVARRVLKKGAIYAVKEGVDAQPWSAESLALNAVGVAWEATEQADLRCWDLLPDRIQVLRVTLPAGEHQLTLQPASGQGVWGEISSMTVKVPDGRNVYVMGQFPNEKLVGQLLTSEP